MSKKHWFNNRHQRCSQCRINVISTFTHDTETTLHQHSFNVYMQHWINVISMSKKNIDSMTDINIASMLLLILDQCWINVFLLSGTGPVRDPQGCHTTPLRTRKGIDTTKIDKNPARASYLAIRTPHGLFKGCLGSQNPYRARKLIMHALKLYGPRTGRQNSYGAARGPFGPRESTYGFCSKQPGNSPYGARECDVTEASPGYTVQGLDMKWHKSSNPAVYFRGPFYQHRLP